MSQQIVYACNDHIIVHNDLIITCHLFFNIGMLSPIFRWDK